MKKEMICFIASLAVFIVLRFLYSYLNVDNLLFLLAPTNVGIELFTGSVGTYSAESGYFYSQLNFIIDKSCSGYNFWLICFMMMSFVFIRSKVIPYYFVIPVSLFLSYAVAILANVSRISGYVLMSRNGLVSYLDPNDSWLHQFEGIFTYLIFLIVSYFILDYLLLKFKHSHEKIA